MAQLKYRLALDVGTNSLGWCVYRLDAQDEICAIVRLGTRIFSEGRDAKTLTSLATNRRLARQARRRRDRTLKRRSQLMNALIKLGLMPSDEVQRKTLQLLDPYELRRKGLFEALTPHELGRAIYHMTRKRGFKSSRKESRAAEDAKEMGKVKTAIAELKKQINLANCQTVGEYLATQKAKHQPVRARRTNDGQYLLYLQRDMIEEEFDLLWCKQQQFHPDVLSDSKRLELKNIFLFQRKLRPVAPGKCQFEIDQDRARLCEPLQQQFRVLQELNNLRLINQSDARCLTLEERNVLFEALSRESKITFPQMRKLIGISPSSGVRFNLESEKRKHLDGDKVSSQLCQPNRIGEEWFSWTLERQTDLALLMDEAESEEELLSALIAEPWQFGLDQASALCRCSLPEDYGNLSHKALTKIVPELKKAVVTYDVAAARAGYDHAQWHSGEFFHRLPYYGEVLRQYTAPTNRNLGAAENPDEKKFGKIANPTVHIGLNQIRLLVNALIKRYGNPQQIVVELAREFGLSGERRRELEKEQDKNQERNAQYDSILSRLGQRVSRDNRLKLQLWYELGADDAMDRCCIYSGKQFNQATLFSDEIEIDHILSFSKSLHDGIGNKLLCFRQANRDKGDRTPYDAFAHAQGMYAWDGIMERVQRHFSASGNPALRRKAMLFRENALATFLQDNDFLSRHLNDTAYLGRVAKQYLSYVCHKDHVWVSTGKLTGMLRGKWGLNELLSNENAKNRDDHRHHALDAAVIGTCSRSLIQRMANAAAQAERQGGNRLLEGLDLPWPGFRQDLKTCLDQVTVSHKPDHGKQAALHNESNYGLFGQPDARGNPLVGRRVPIDSLNGGADFESMPNGDFKTELLQRFAGLTGKAFKSELAIFMAQTGVRRVMRLERLSVVPILDRRTGKPYRYVKTNGNYCYEIFRTPNGKWDGEVISIFDANQGDYVESKTSAKCGLPLVMRIHKDDMISIETEQGLQVLRVVKFSSGKINFASHREANVAARNSNAEESFKLLQFAPSKLLGLKARAVGVDVLGFVNDPGFKP